MGHNVRSRLPGPEPEPHPLRDVRDGDPGGRRNPARRDLPGAPGTRIGASLVGGFADPCPARSRPAGDPHAHLGRAGRADRAGSGRLAPRRGGAVARLHDAVLRIADPAQIPAKALVWSPLGALGGSTVEIVQFMGRAGGYGLATATYEPSRRSTRTCVLSAPYPHQPGAARGRRPASSRWARGRRAASGMVARIDFVLLFPLYWVILLLPLAYFDWYLPPFTAVARLLAGPAFSGLGGPGSSSSLAVLLAIAFAAHLPFSFPLEARIQREIEDGIRRQVGLYLARVVAADEAFVAEAAGYFGYYSRATIWDPGTDVTDRVVPRSSPFDAWRRHRRAVAVRIGRSCGQAEWDRLERHFPGAASATRPKRFLGPRIPHGVNGLVKWNQDRSYTVFRRDGCGTMSSESRAAPASRQYPPGGRRSGEAADARVNH